MLVGTKLEQFRPVLFLQHKASRTGAADLHQFVYGSSPKTLFILWAKKEDFLESQFACPETKEGRLQFACPGDKRRKAPRRASLFLGFLFLFGVGGSGWDGFLSLAFYFLFGRGLPSG